MKELYKKINENPSLLNFIEIDFDFITKLVEESINDVATKNFMNKNKEAILKIFKKNLNLNTFIDDLTKTFKNKDYTFKIHLLKFLIQNNILLEKHLIENRYKDINFKLINDSNNRKELFNLMLKDDTFFFYLTKNIKFENIRNIELFVSIIKNRNLVEKFFQYCIDNDNLIINPKDKIENNLRYNMLYFFKELPIILEPYLTEKCFLSKIKSNKSIKELIDLNIHFHNLGELKDSLETLNPEDLAYLHLKLEFKHIKSSKYLYNSISKNLLFDILNKELKNTNNLEQIKNLILERDKNDLNLYFLHNLNIDLRLIVFVNENIVIKNYKQIRDNILKGVPVGKQGLKFFALKNKNKLDKEFLEYILNIYPKFYNSLNIKEEVEFKKNIINFISLKDVIYKKDLTEFEMNLIKKHLKKVLKINYTKKLNKEVSNLIKTYLKELSK